MKKLLLLLLATVFIGISIVWVACAGWAQNVTPYKLTSMQAKLFYTDRGTFSDNIIDNPEYAELYNTIIGEGSSGGPATDVLVLLKVNGKPGSFESREVHLIATSGKKVLLNREASIGVLSEHGEAYVAFWIYNCTDEKLKIRAEITGQSTKSAIYKVIPFYGGE